MSSSPLSPQSGLGALSGAFDVVLSDVWGVVHNGISAYAAACEALRRFRGGGGTVVLVSNAPRPSTAVVAQLDAMGVPREAWDGIVTSGDVTKTLLASRGARRVHHIGPARDLPIFDGLGIDLVSPDAAEIAVVTGLDDDEREHPDEYRARLSQLAARRLTLVCANPDRVVERGENLVWCAGALGDLYGELGGEVVSTGKPEPIIYEAALAVAAACRQQRVDHGRVLAIGDAVRTDVKGAANAGLPVVFVTHGIHAAELGHPAEPEKLGSLLAGLPAPLASMPRLVW
jgi:HAD superfamily hydrolase (TIGR01459 family)